MILMTMAYAAVAALPPETHRLQPDHLPTPFSAAQIREASPEGYTTRHVVRVEGQPTTVTVNTFVAAEDGEAVAAFRYYNTNEAGDMLGEAKTGEATWRELQAHASFPAELTTVEEVEVTVPMGTFTCWLYTVTRNIPSDVGEKTAVSRFWFAQDLPGPPVKMVQAVDGDEKMSMVLLSAGVE
ncbi:hypothetical protein [Actomonas aquatica]|uniref:Uncharacterized protein n=1 Tax=Actomonas aquatica TaxID=2866162 RepID=A0ABZ1C5J7_9BACT|nr:hypothetical protein [Opitutus sp. WL0086]WRQ85794.1 hypothetical protein K1X11_013360 [Opitutus sp. WL0086]